MNLIGLQKVRESKLYLFFFGLVCIPFVVLVDCFPDPLRTNCWESILSEKNQIIKQIILLFTNTKYCMPLLI